MTTPNGLVFLLDVDNTLLDNDQFEADLRSHLGRELGGAGGERYWRIFESLRGELGYADYLGALQRYRSEDLHRRFPLQLSSFLLEYPFAQRLYPAALDVVEHFRAQGTAVILSDGDAVFQPRKIERSGLWKAVDGRVLIYIHKETMLDAVMVRFPAKHYVMVDDKLRILTAMKGALGPRLTTVFLRQGHYSAESPKGSPPPDIVATELRELLALNLSDLLNGQP